MSKVALKLSSESIVQGDHTPEPRSDLFIRHLGIVNLVIDESFKATLGTKLNGTERGKRGTFGPQEQRRDEDSIDRAMTCPQKKHLMKLPTLQILLL